MLSATEPVSPDLGKRPAEFPKTLISRRTAMPPKWIALRL
jgi:hypothetical protein